MTQYFIIYSATKLLFEVFISVFHKLILLFRHIYTLHLTYVKIDHLKIAKIGLC